MMPSMRLMALPFAALLTQCAPVMGQPAIPNDGNDDLAALQQQIDETARRGGGVVQLEEGRYHVSKPLYLRTGVELRGRGPGTVITNEGLNNASSWLGITVLAGSLNPGSYVSNGGRGHTGIPVTISGERTVTFEDCRPGLPSPEEGTVVWLASEDGIIAGGDNLRPAAGEVSRVESEEGCDIVLADPIGVPDDMEIRLYWDRGGVAVFDGLGENAPIADAAIRDLQIRSTRSQALISSGCYSCEFTGLTIGRSRRFIVVQGMRHTVYRNIRGSFTERGIEVTMLAKDNLVEDARGTFDPDPGMAARPAIRFGEFATGNTLRDIELDLGDKFGRQIYVRFDEAGENTLQDVTLNVTGTRSPRPVAYRPRGARRARITVPDGTMLDEVSVCHRTAGGNAAARDCATVDSAGRYLPQ